MDSVTDYRRRGNAGFSARVCGLLTFLEFADRTFEAFREFFGLAATDKK